MKQAIILSWLASVVVEHSLSLTSTSRGQSVFLMCVCCW